MLTYATVEQLAGHVSAAQLDKLDDGDDVRYIEAASVLVRRATKNDQYEATPAGLPTDPVLSEALTTATCWQVRQWIALSVNPLAGAAGVKPAASSASVNGASVAYDVAASSAARADSATSLCDASRDVLRDVGLASAAVGRA
ncbi:hypothetical protein [Nocardia bovistercoris]|uniref:Uncharacterized protein n=1 Tax=Nocardia bovistercoris TaxID=2785916 RepID=A0A931IFM9_9NOCA|nr:hypothetical protein [Nocardia bovistercoris]MBH0778818.1 hypothetical protein [Nocardia bovistercoris]